MVKRHLGILILLVFFLSFCTAYAAYPPYLDSDDNGDALLMVPVVNEHIEVGKNYTFKVHVHDAIDETVLTPENIDMCVIQVYDSGGDEISSGAMSAGTTQMLYEVDGSNLNSTGQYSVYMSCRETSVAGFVAYPFYVTNNGYPPITMGQGLIVFSSILIVVMFSILLFVFSYRFNSDTFKIIALVTSTVMFLIAAMYSMVTMDNLVYDYSNVVGGYSTFFTVLIYAAMILFIVFMIFALLVGIRFYKFKRGWID